MKEQTTEGSAELAQKEGWIPFSERWPEEVAALDDPNLKVIPRVLVTNNLKARNRMGEMSHIWLASPIKASNPEQDGDVVAYTDGDCKIRFLTHWKAINQAKPAEMGDLAKAAKIVMDSYDALKGDKTDAPEFAILRAALAAQTAAPGEIESLRAQQAERVMPLIGPLLDGYEGAELEDEPELNRWLGEINKAMTADEYARPSVQMAAPGVKAVAWLSEQWSPCLSGEDAAQWQECVTLSDPTSWDGFRNARPLYTAAPAAAPVDLSNLMEYGAGYIKVFGDANQLYYKSDDVRALLAAGVKDA